MQRLEGMVLYSLGERLVPKQVIATEGSVQSK
jgi:hypothetical protein